MQVGLMAPQGWKGEYDGWPPADAWARTVELATQAEELGFESLWVFDHFHTVPEPTDEITFESFSVLAALAMVTTRVRLGHMVVCTGFRNPALTAKLSSTIDVISGGRFELGIGAGWKEDEWIAYGYGFPPLAERHGRASATTSRSSRAMFEPGPGDVRGPSTPTSAARSTSRKGLQQPRIPIIVGGNGARRTAGYAIRYADELNFVFLEPGRHRRADARRPSAVRGRGTRSGDAAVLALRARRADARRRAGRVDLTRADAPRSGSTGSSRSRPAGRRRSRRRRPSPRTAGRPGSRSRARRWRPRLGRDGSGPTTP